MNDKMKTMPKVAVLLAAFNGIKWLDDQVHSILSQKDVSLHIFVSVDLSTDGTERFLINKFNSDPKFTFLPYGQHFGGAGRNFFRMLKDLNLAEFDFVCFADQDDIWLPNKLSRAINMLAVNNADAYSSNVTAFWPDGREVLIKKSQLQTKWDFLFEAAGPGCTYVMSSDFIIAVQHVVTSQWDEMQAVGLHDWFVYAFARSNGYKWFIDDVPSMLYRQHASNQLGVNTGWSAFKHRSKNVLNGWGLAQSELIARLVGLGSDNFVQRWSGGSRLGMIWLACNAWRCRRRVRDKFLFALSCLTLAIVGKRLS